MTPQRIQRRRVKGWRKPLGAISVCRPGKYGNPFRVINGDAEAAVDQYGAWLRHTPEGQQIVEDAMRELRGHDLMCFCAVGGPCHGDVLLRIANEEVNQ